MQISHSYSEIYKALFQLIPFKCTYQTYVAARHQSHFIRLRLLLAADYDEKHNQLRIWLRELKNAQNI